MRLRSVLITGFTPALSRRSPSSLRATSVRFIIFAVAMGMADASATSRNGDVSRALSGGGELIDQGSHLIDLSRWFLGDLVLDYAATPTYFWNIDVEDNCFLALRGRQGEMAWLHATWTEWKNMFSFEIVGRDGKLTIEGLGGSYGVERLIFHKMLPELGPPETTIWEYPFPDTSWTREFASFEVAVAGEPSQIADIDDACEVLAIVETAYGGTEP